MITNVLLAIQAVTVLVPAIIELIKQFEVPGVPGNEKKNAVLEVLKGILDTLPVMGIRDIPATIILTVASSVIDTIVAGFNTVGIFKKVAK